MKTKKDILKEAEYTAFKNKGTVWVWKDAHGQYFYGDSEPSTGEIVVKYSHPDYTCEWNDLCDHWTVRIFRYLNWNERAAWRDDFGDDDMEGLEAWLRTLDAYDEFEDDDIEKILGWHEENGLYDDI